MAPQLQYMAAYISNWLLKIPRVGARLAEFYSRLWNPINYMIVGGLGVVINMIVAGVLWWQVSFLPWWLINFVAIFVAWLWNWANSVGPFGWAWGFRDRENKYSRTKS